MPTQPNSSEILAENDCDSKNNKNLVKSNSATVKDYVILKAKKSDFQEIYNFMLKDFLWKEPLNEALNVTEEDAKIFFSEIIKCSLEDDASNIVRRHHNCSDNKDKIVAICLSCVITRPKDSDVTTLSETIEKVQLEVTKPETASIFASKTSLPQNIQKIEKFLNAIESKTWTLLPESKNRLLSIVILSVDSKFTRRGIAQQLIDLNVEEAKRLNCQGVITEATAFNSQQLFAKCGYTRIYEIQHSEWLAKETNEQIFRCKDLTDRATLEFKEV